MKAIFGWLTIVMSKRIGAKVSQHRAEGAESESPQAEWTWPSKPLSVVKVRRLCGGQLERTS